MSFAAREAPQPPPETDGVLAQRAVAGEDAAFAILMQRHKAALYRFIRRYVGHDDDAFDILQDSFVSAWTALKRFDPQRPFPVWLRQIALNKCREQLDAAIVSLPVTLREPLILCVFENLSHRETAQLLGISEKAVETRLYRAKRELAARIDRTQLDSLHEDVDS